MFRLVIFLNLFVFVFLVNNKITKHEKRKLSSLERFAAVKDYDLLGHNATRRGTLQLPSELRSKDYSNYPVQPSHFEESNGKYKLKENRNLGMLLELQEDGMYEKTLEDNGNTVVLTSEGQVKFLGTLVTPGTIEIKFSKYFSWFEFKHPRPADITDTLNFPTIDVIKLFNDLKIQPTPYFLDRTNWINGERRVNPRFPGFIQTYLMHDKDMISMKLIAPHPDFPKSIYCTTTDASASDPKYRCIFLVEMFTRSFMDSLNERIPNGWMKPADLEQKIPFLLQQRKLLFHHSEENIEIVDFDVFKNLEFGIDEKKYLFGFKREPGKTELIEFRDTIEGGSDFVTFRFITQKGDVGEYLNYDEGEKVIFKCKFFQEKIDVTLIPPVPIQTSNIQKFLNTQENIPLAQNFELVKMVVRSRDFCFHLKLQDDDREPLGGMVSIVNTTFIFCKGPPFFPAQIECENNDNERAFQAKAEICLRSTCDDQRSICPFEIYGKLQTYDFPGLREVAPNSLTGNHLTNNPNLFKFPVDKLVFGLAEGQPYSRIDGVADFHGKPFKIQAVYKTSQDLALCLEYMKVTTKDNEDVDNGPLSILDVAKLLAAQTTAVTSNTNLKFNDIMLSFQSENFYTQDMRGNDKLRCRSMSQFWNRPNEQESREEGWTNKVDFPPVIISAKNLNTQCDEMKGDCKIVCNFFRRGYSTVTQTRDPYYGYYDGDQLEMFFKLPQNSQFQLFNGLSLDASNGNEVKFAFGLVFSTGPNVSPYDKIVGRLKSTTYQWLNNREVTLTLNGGAGFLIMPERVDDVPLFLGTSHVKGNVIRSRKHEIQVENLELIELHCDIQVGTAETRQPIQFTAEPGESRQFLHSESANNKFWSCRTGGSDDMNKLLDSLGLKENQFLIGNGVITTLCIVSTPEEEWDIEEKNITARSGLSYHGEYTIRAIDRKGEERDFPHLKFELHFEEKKLKTQLPPIYNGKVFEVQSIKEAPDLGPELEIDFSDTATTYGKFTGVTKILGMDMGRNLKIEKTNAIGFLNRPQTSDAQNNDFVDCFTVSGTLGNQLRLQTLQVEFSGEKIIGRVQSEFTKIRQKTMEDFESKFGVVDRNWTEIQNILNKYKPKQSTRSKIASLLSDMSEIENKYYGYMDGLSEECKAKCKMSMVPGFTWDNCQLSKSMRNVSCLKFKKDAFASTNMHCLANCEINQADIYDRSSIEGDKYEVLKKTVNELRVPVEMYNELNGKTDTTKQHFKDDIYEPFKTFNTQLESNIKTQAQVSAFTATILDMTDANQETSERTEFPVKNLPMSVTVDGAVKSETYSFDENIATRIAAKRFEEASRVKKDEFMAHLRTADECLIKLREAIISWEAKYRVELARLQRGIRSSKRHYIDEMNLPDKLSSMFTKNKPDVSAVVDQFAPWNTLANNDPLRKINNRGKNIHKRDYISKSFDDCSTRRNKLSMYEDISLYMKSWTRAYDDSKKTLEEYQKDISNGLKQFAHDITLSKRSHNNIGNSTMEEVQGIWYNRLSNGFKKWSKELNRQVNHLHSKGPKKMLNEINNLFTPTGHDTLRSYFQSNDVINKRSSDMTSLQQIERTFALEIPKIKTLTDGKQMLSQINNLINQAKLTETRCHDEL